MKSKLHDLFIIHALVALALNFAVNQQAKAVAYTFILTGSMNVPREYHTATLLPNGQVLVAGGQVITNSITLATATLASAELYNPVTGTWTLTGPMNIARSLFTATLLPNGKVLVVAGDASNTSAELYNPATGTWTMTGPMNIARSAFTATLLPNGKVLVAGGFINDTNGTRSSAELYDPATGTWTMTGQMNDARYANTATLLPNGKVLVAGTVQGNGYGGINIGHTAELYDPATGTWALTGPLNGFHMNHTANLLANGQVLVAGGFGVATSFILSDAELYDPTTGTWTVTGSLNSPRENFTATLLPSGQVLAAGGYELLADGLFSTELYDPAGGTWTQTNSLNYGRQGHTATLLPNGQVLLAGGEQNPNTIYSNVDVTLNSAELFAPQVGQIEATLGPSAVLGSHPQWRVDGVGHFDSGAVEGPYSLGNHTVSFTAVPGWVTPPDQIVTVPMQATTNITATYIPATTSLQVNLTPPGAVSAGAQWQVDGGADQNSGAIVGNLTTGSHTVTFTTVAGWITPASQSVTISPGVTNTASATYIPIGALQVNLAPPGAVSAGAQWQVDNGAFQNSGTVVSNLTVGSHMVVFSTVAGWNTPASQLVTISQGVTNTVSATYIPNTGAVQVNLTPPGAVGAGAQWRVDNGAPQNSGTVVGSLAPGTYTVGFTTVAGWIAPNSQLVTISQGVTNTVSATYIQSKGSLQVTVGPSGAVSAGAQWQVDGGAFENSGTVVSNLVVGSHTVTFSTVAGWITPASQSVTISQGATTTANATYIPNTGALQVNLTPPGAVSAGVQWQVDGGAYENSGSVVSNLIVGSHTVTFSTVAGWFTPASQSVTINFGTTTNISATYAPNVGNLQVSITPPSAVSAGAQWQVDGGLWQNSGAILTNLAGGNHLVAFTTVSRWFTPANQTVTIYSGATANISATYTPNIGALQVDLNPVCAVEGGAEWQLDGGAWQTSGAVVTNLAGGNHIVSFTNIVGWLAPSSLAVMVTANNTNTFAGNYLEGSTPGVITWINIGGADQHWSTATNWDLNRAPTPSDIVLIPYTGGNTCVLDVDATVAGLTLGACEGVGSDGLNLNGHTLTVNGPITIKSNAVFAVTSGTLVGGSNAIVSGAIGWSLGTLGGTLTLASNCVLTTSAATFNKNLSCILTNYGTFNWSGDQLNGGGAGTVIYNYGLWNALDNQTLGGSGTVFNNYGIFRKSGGTPTYPGTLFSGVLFNQADGVLDVQSGTNGLELVLQGGANFTGGYVTTNSNGFTYLSIGNFNVNGTVTCSNVVEVASLVGTNVIRGGLTWLNGNWNGTVTIGSNCVVNTSGTTYGKTFNGCLVTNYGTFNWSQDQLNGSGGAIIYNYGLWNAQDNQGVNGTVFNNYGTFLKSGGASGYPGTLFNGSTAFNQVGGILNVQTADVTLQGTYLLTNGTINFGINSATNNGVLLAGNLTLGGVLSANVSGNFAPAVGEQFGLIGSSALSGTFSSVHVPPGIAVVYTNNGVVLIVTGPVPVQLLKPQLAGTNLSFQFPTVSGQSYTIQRNDILTSTNWVYYTNITGSGALFQFQTPVPAIPAQRFFRVRQP